MKLDLRKSRAQTTYDDDFFSELESKPSIFSEIEPVHVVASVVRVAIFVAGVLALMHFEKNQLNKLNAIKAKEQGTLNTLNKKIKKLEKDIKNYEYLNKQTEEFNQKLSIMDQIVDNRLSALKGLDRIQTVIPQKVWLKKVDYRDKTFSLEGVSVTNRDLQKFTEALENTNLFSQVVIEKSSMSSGKNKLKNRREFIVESVLK